MSSPLRQPRLIHCLVLGLVCAGSVTMGPQARGSGRGGQGVRAKLQEILRKKDDAEKAAVAKVREDILHEAPLDLPVKVWPAPGVPAPASASTVQGPAQPEEPGRAKATAGTPFAAKRALPKACLRARFPEFSPAPASGQTVDLGRVLVCAPRNPARMGSRETGFRTVHGDEIWIKGYLIKPGTLLQGADLSHTDLRGLKMTDLGLECADLEGAQCKDARFHGSRLFGVNATGTSHLDFTGAVPHPFLHALRNDDSALQFLEIPAEGKASAPPKDILISQGRTLFWLESEEGVAKVLNEYGAWGRLHGQDGNTELGEHSILGLALDAQERLWLFTRQLFAFRPAQEMWALSKMNHGPHHLPEADILNVTTTPRNLVHLGGEKTIGVFGTKSATKAFGIAYTAFAKHLPASSLCCLEQSEPGQMLYLAVPFDQPGVIMAFLTPTANCQAQVHRIELPAGCRPQCLAADPQGTPAGCAWFTDPGNGTVYKLEFSPEHGPALTPIRLAGPQAAPWSVALGPHGLVWFTEPSADRIGCILKDGQAFQYDLPSGSHPNEIVGFHDGAVLFSCRGQRRIGALRYLPPAPPPGKSSAAAAPPGVTRPEADIAASLKLVRPRRPRPRSRTAASQQVESKNRHVSCVLGEDTEKAKVETPTAPEDSSAASATTGPVLELENLPAAADTGAAGTPAVTPVQAPRAATPPAGPDPSTLLASWDVRLSLTILGKIITDHTPGRHIVRDGCFEEEFSDWRNLEALIAEAVDREGGLSETLHLDGRRRTFLTHTRLVGTWYDQTTGQRVDTRRFLLVTGPRLRGAGPANVVITAFPVR